MEVYEDITIRGVGWSRLAVNVLPLGSPAEGIGLFLNGFGEGFEVNQPRFLIFIEGLDCHSLDEGCLFLHPIPLFAVPQALGHRTLPEVAIIRSGVKDVVGERNGR